MSEKNGSSNKIDLSQDEGFVEVTLGGETRRVDTWGAYWQILGCWEQGLASAEYNRRLREVLAGIGYEQALNEQALSCLAVDRFAQAIIGRVNDLKKKEPASASSASPTPTGSGSSA